MQETRVPPHVRRLRGTVRAQQTLVGFLPRVRPPVLGEVALVAELLVTKVAAEPPVGHAADAAAEGLLPREQRGTRASATPASRLRFEPLACTAHPTIQPATLSPYERNPEYSQPALQQKATHWGCQSRLTESPVAFSLAFVFTTLKHNDLAPGIPNGYTSLPDLSDPHSTDLPPLSLLSPLPFAPPSLQSPLPPPLPSAVVHHITGRGTFLSYITDSQLVYEISHSFSTRETPSQEATGCGD